MSKTKQHLAWNARQTLSGFVLVGLLGLLAACGDEEIIPADPPAEVQEQEYVWDLPEGFPTPKVPQDNPMTVQKAELGRYLFYDKRMSGNETFSCGSCHLQDKAFTDGRALAKGSTGQEHHLSSMSLTNIAYVSRLAWANPLLDTLEAQALIPMFGEDPVELGMVGREQEILARFAADPQYQILFAEAFPQDEDPFTVKNLARALASFQRTLISGNSPYDRYIYGLEDDAMSPSALRGLRIFSSELTECFHCHGGYNFSDSATHEGKVFDENAYHNTGLYNLDEDGSYPPKTRGLFELTGNPADMGRFRAPTLRNIAVTAPYMHDGSIETLDEVIEHYAAGGRTLEDGPYAGVGADNPHKSEFVPGFRLSDRDKADLKAFLESLTDESFLVDPRFANPFGEEE